MVFYVLHFLLKPYEAMKRNQTHTQQFHMNSAYKVLFLQQQQQQQRQKQREENITAKYNPSPFFAKTQAYT